MGKSKKKDKKKKKRRHRSSSESASEEGAYSSPDRSPQADKDYEEGQEMSILEYMQKAMREDQKLKKTLTTDKKTDKNRAPPLTEEHVYDYDGEQMIRDAIREARDMSISPERDSPRRRDRSPSPGKKYSNNSSKITPEEHRPKDPRLMRSKNTEDPRQKKRTVIDYDTYSSRDRRRDRSRDRSRSPVERKSREITPPPMPPGMDWPFEAPKNDLEWKQKDDRSRDRDYQDDVNRKLKSKMREERRGKFV